MPLAKQKKRKKKLFYGRFYDGGSHWDLGLYISVIAENKSTLYFQTMDLQFCIEIFSGSVYYYYIIRKKKG